MKERYKHVIIIGIDGMGNFNKDTATPNMDELFADGAVSYYGVSLFPTISAQNWGAMLLGVNPEVHGLTNEIVGTTEYTNKEYPSIFTTVREKYPDEYLCSCSNWNPINHGIIEHDIGVDMYTAETDFELIEQIEKCIEKKPKLLFIQFDDIDGSGHGKGYGTKEYLADITEEDKLIGRIVAAYKKAGIYDDTLFITIADHGGYIKGHGGYTDTEKDIFFGIAGKGVKKGEIPACATRDVNAVVRYAFGIDIPAYKEGSFTSQVPMNVFEDYSGNYNVKTPVPSSIINEPTPEINGENGLYTFIDKDIIKLALFFDNDNLDATGKNKITEINHPKFYSNGRYGSYGELGTTGILTADDLKFGAESFTVSVWLKLEKGIHNTCFVCATKNMVGPGAGFAIGFSRGGTVVCFENDKKGSYKELITPYFEDISEGWIHTAFSFDRKNKEIRVYHDFKLKNTIAINSGFDDFPLDCLPFTIGDEAKHTSNCINRNFIFNLDDLFIFNGALGDEEMKKLAAYYKK